MSANRTSSILLLAILLMAINLGGSHGQTDKILDNFLNGKRTFRVGDKFQAYNALVSSVPTYYAATLTNDNCVGLTIDNSELLILDCPGRKSKEPGCFEVLSIESKGQNRIREKGKTCVKLDKRCVAVTTPRNVTVLLWCPIPILGNVANIKNNGEPPRE